MTNEEQAAVRGIGAKALDVDMPPMQFDNAGRNMLLQHYAGLAMHAYLRAGTFDSFAADTCVTRANQLVMALERHATLEAAKAQGNG